MIIKTAVISPCGTYRYSLGRDDDMPPPDSKGTTLFVLVNPSVADANIDDATVKKCWKYTINWRYHRMLFVNTNPYRSTKPKLAQIPPPAVLDENDTHIRFAANQADLVVCAWGNNADPALVARAMAVLKCQKPLHYVALSKRGVPKHPLYQLDILKPTLWRPDDVQQP